MTRRRIKQEVSSEELWPNTQTIEPREGDVLTVSFNGAKINVGNYTTIELDAAHYQRILREGDDPEIEFERIYEFLKKKVFQKAASKFAEIQKELGK